MHNKINIYKLNVQCITLLVWFGPFVFMYIQLELVHRETTGYNRCSIKKKVEF